MDRRTLGGNGPQLSVVGLGCNNFGMKLDEAASVAVVHAALDAGITHFDTAEMYGKGQSEAFLGAALGGRRDEAVIATKFTPRPKDEPYTPGAQAARIREACESSLERLGTDRIDLYYQHYADPDPAAPVDEALETLDQLVSEGKVLHIASSNLDPGQLRAADAAAGERGQVRFCGTQIEWNILSRGVETEIVPTAVELGIGLIPYFPLASGLLTGKYRRGADFPAGSRFDRIGVFGADASDENFDRVERLTEFAESRGHPVLELAIAWLAAQPGVASVIAGATTPDQVRANAAVASWRLDAGDLAAVEDLL